MWEQRVIDTNDNDSSFAVEWFSNRLKEASGEVNNMMQQFRLSEALKSIYSLIWDDFCSWYLEWVKPGFEQPISKTTYLKTIEFFSSLMQLLHPFMPFVTEEIYHQLAERNDDICIKSFGTDVSTSTDALQNGDLLKQAISGIRDVRNKQQIKPKETIKLFIQTQNNAVYQQLQVLLAKQINADSIQFTQENISDSFTVVIGKDTFYIATEKPVDKTGQKESLEKELAYFQGFLTSVEKKLGNERFIQNAKPDVIALEQKKKADAEAKIKIITESIQALS
jgi:valyl-tRNA synthetase